MTEFTREDAKLIVGWARHERWRYIRKVLVRRYTAGDITLEELHEQLAAADLRVAMLVEDAESILQATKWMDT